MLPVYRQVAEHFADLHDRPGRMLAKGVIRSVVPWRRARVFFFHRLRRRLSVFEAVALIREAKPSLSRAEGASELKRLFERSANHLDWTNDKEVFQWIKDQKAQAGIISQVRAGPENGCCAAKCSAARNSSNVTLSFEHVMRLSLVPNRIQRRASKSPK